MVTGNTLTLRVLIREKLIINGVPNYPMMIDGGFSLYRLKHELGLLDATMVIAAMIASLCGAFNVSKNMSAEQIQDYSLTFLESNIHGSYDQPSLRVEDLAVFCELAKTGTFGRPYNYIDGALINEWFNAYLKERDNAYYDWLKYGRHETAQPIEDYKPTIERKDAIDNIIAQCTKGKAAIDSKANDTDEVEKRRQDYVNRQRERFYRH